jgi:lipoprotein-anchoring transpeptidase ErfK/SrfK
MEVLMSRTSRRISRPLIALLAIVLVLGLFFGLHKLHQAHADEAKAGPVPIVIEPVAPPATPAQPLEVATSPKPTAPAITVEKPLAPDATALVTQTPTEKTGSDPKPAAPEPSADSQDTSPSPGPSPSPSPASPVAAPTTPVEAVVPADQADPDNSGLAQWAHKPGAHDAPPAHITPLATASDTSSAVAHDATPPVHATLSAQPLVDAKARVEAGDLVAARDILNEALISGHAADADSIKKQIEQINQTVIFSPQKFPADPWGGSYQVMGGERLATIAARNNVSWEYLARINNVTPRRLRQGQTIKIAKGPFYAVVYKAQFLMEIYLGAPGGQGSMYVRSFPVGLGKDNSTPTGLWMCKAGDKIRNPRYYPSRGGDVIAPDDPKNPLGGYWIAIEGLDGQAVGKESYGIHGTIDPDSIGKMESQGCIRLKEADISWVFDLLVDGKSKVLIKD